MAVLLVAIGVMTVLLSAAMPVWRQMAQREKEEELVFRGQQYARAVGLFERKFANAPPPSIDVLVQQKFLRKKYKDPITNDDFVPVTAAQGASPTPGGRAGGGAPQTQTGQQQQTAGGNPAGGRAGTTPGAGTQGGIVGVVSKSPAQSIRVYNGRTKYNEWVFVYAPPAPTPGAGGAPGTGAPGQRGQPQRGGQQPQGPFGPGGAGGPGGRGQGQGGPNRGGPQRGAGNGQGAGGFTNPFQGGLPARGR